MKEEIKEYLDKKIYSAKKGAIALALCGATTLALTGCGNENTTNNEAQIEQQIDQSAIYRLYTERGFIDLNIEKIYNDEHFAGDYANNYIDYYTIDDYKITFRNNGCIIENPNNEVIATYQNAYIEELDFELDVKPYNENENAKNPLSYETNQMENTINLEN